MRESLQGLWLFHELKTVAGRAVARCSAERRGPESRRQPANFTYWPQARATTLLVN